MKFLVAFVLLCGLGIGAYTYTYLQKTEIESKTGVGFILVDKTYEDIINTLASPENCLATLGARNAITDSSVTKIQKEGKELFRQGMKLDKSNLVINSYQLESTPVDLKKNTAHLVINFKDIKSPGKEAFNKKALLYVEVDGADNISYCHTLSSSLQANEQVSKVRLRVIHVSGVGILAKSDGVRTSIAVATCPKNTSLTGCSGSVGGCGAAGESLRKVEPQAINPNTCEVWADATPACPVEAKALAICMRIIQ